MRILWVIIGALAGLTVGYGGGYLKGRADGKAFVLNQAVADRVITLEEGRKVDEKVSNADDSVLCSLLGGC